MAERQKERDEGEDGSELKVTDRRLFTPDGQLRGEIDGGQDEEDAGEAAPRESEPVPNEVPTEQQTPGGRSDAAFERRSLEEPQGVDFTMLVNAMAQPALIFLGEIPHPGTGQPEINLEQARLQIDLLDMLRIRCRGNLSQQEESLLDRMLYQLRMLYVARSSQPD